MTAAAKLVITDADRQAQWPTFEEDNSGSKPMVKVYCSRCDGSGRYSWCPQYGDLCLKCMGGKFQWVTKSYWLATTTAMIKGGIIEAEKEKTMAEIRADKDAFANYMYPIFEAFLAEFYKYNPSARAPFYLEYLPVNFGPGMMVRYWEKAFDTRFDPYEAEKIMGGLDRADGPDRSKLVYAPKTYRMKGIEYNLEVPAPGDQQAVNRLKWLANNSSNRGLAELADHCLTTYYIENRVKNPEVNGY